jgi:hypothetical protein
LFKLHSYRYVARNPTLTGHNDIPEIPTSPARLHSADMGGLKQPMSARECGRAEAFAEKTRAADRSAAR